MRRSDSPVDYREAILAAVEAHAVMLDLGVAVAGEERVLFYGSTKAALDRLGIQDEDLVWRITDFLSIALARPPLRALGVRLDDHYARIDSSGRLRTYRRLDEEPVYRAADAVVAQLDKGLRAVGFGPQTIAIIGAMAAAVWALNGWWLGRQHDAAAVQQRADVT